MKNLIYKLPLDKSIIYLMLFLLPIDMVNGFLLTNNIILPISISQAFKMLIVLLIFLNLAQYPKQFFLSIFIILVLMVPSFFQLFKNLDFSLLMNDLIKITKYVIPIFAFLFFRNYLKKDTSKLVFKLVNFSYFILVINILLKHLGVGYPMYNFGDIGSKGFFYAGNEVSALLLILSSIVSFNLWKRNKFFYVLMALFNIVVALSIASKTSVFGVILIHILIPIKRPTIRKINLKIFANVFLVTLILLPAIVYYGWSYVKASSIYNRLYYFYDKFDFLTFILSNRNVFLKDSLQVYLQEYNFLEKIIGVGQTSYEQMNHLKLVEIDVVDIFFAYAFIGLFLFIFALLFVGVQAVIFSKNIEKYLYANFVLMMLLILFVISSTAGHVFSSGMAGIYIGLIFSLFYISKASCKNEVLSQELQ
ncbi:O-antigen ligase family protein [Mesonia sp. MT50]|uniref:O-antigen ligase family protein n=1 Tax=Mesonia profundi TaxID=3070998 RepID=A0ABU1A1F0_9FLAO|nr:O-antigen ligase family protein [Mesonia profundi]MDQ7916541.1 O-antigen ligase family protein [Mesonia profundi]